MKKSRRLTTLVLLMMLGATFRSGAIIACGALMAAYIKERMGNKKAQNVYLKISEKYRVKEEVKKEDLGNALAELAGSGRIKIDISEFPIIKAETKRR